MAVKTIRFNDQEEKVLGQLLKHYHEDFSGFVKQLIQEKLEDLGDQRSIRRIKEGSPRDYVSAADIDRMFK